MIFILGIIAGGIIMSIYTARGKSSTKADELFIKFIMAVVLIFLVWALTINEIEQYQEAQAKEQQLRGVAISNFIEFYHNYDVPPEQARFFDVGVTTYDITIKDLEVFMTMQPEK